MPSSFTLSESLFLQRILVSALPGLHSLVQATSHLGTEEATGPGMHTAAPNLSQADIFQWKVGSHQPHSLEPLTSSHCSRDKAKAITLICYFLNVLPFAHSLPHPARLRPASPTTSCISGASSAHTSFPQLSSPCTTVGEGIYGKGYWR